MKNPFDFPVGLNFFYFHQLFSETRAEKVRFSPDSGRELDGFSGFPAMACLAPEFNFYNGIFF